MLFVLVACGRRGTPTAQGCPPGVGRARGLVGAVSVGPPRGLLSLQPVCGAVELGAGAPGDPATGGLLNPSESYPLVGWPRPLPPDLARSILKCPSSLRDP